MAKSNRNVSSWNKEHDRLRALTQSGSSDQVDRTLINVAKRGARRNSCSDINDF